MTTHAHAHPRLNILELAPGPLRAFIDANIAIVQGPLDGRVRELVKIRASQLNGCAYCVDMHVREARALGEADDRLHHLAVWRESQLFSAAERAALAYTEAATVLSPDSVSDEIWEAAQAAFEPAPLAALVAQVALINAFNRIAVPLRTPPGYAPPSGH